MMTPGCAALCDERCRARPMMRARPKLSVGAGARKTSPGSLVRLSRVLPSGGRAVSLRVAASGAPMDWIRAEDKVDVVLLTRGVPAGGSGSGQGSVLLMQNARVLSVTGGANRRPGTYRLTLLALPAEAQALLLASQRGRFVIFLRNPSDGLVGAGGTITERHLADPAFWRRLLDKRMRTLQRPGKAPTCIPRSKRQRDIAL